MRLSMVTRAEWGSQQTRVTLQPGPMREVFIHHVGGRWPHSLIDERAHMRELQIYALNGKGGRYPIGTYSDLDYSVLIGPSGTPYEGRGFFTRPAATLDRNGVSRAICLMGNTDLRAPTHAQLETLTELIVYMIDIGSLSQSVTIYGHYQNPAHPNATECPGRFMVPYIPQVRAEVARLLTPVKPSPDPPEPSEDDVEILHVYVPNDPTRAEALVMLKMTGFNNPAERDAVVRALAARKKPVSAAQYDALVAVVTGG